MAAWPTSCRWPPHAAARSSLPSSSWSLFSGRRDRRPAAFNDACARTDRRSSRIISRPLLVRRQPAEIAGQLDHPRAHRGPVAVAHEFQIARCARRRSARDVVERARDVRRPARSSRRATTRKRSRRSRKSRTSAMSRPSSRWTTSTFCAVDSRSSTNWHRRRAENRRRGSASRQAAGQRQRAAGKVAEQSSHSPGRLRCRARPPTAKIAIQIRRRRRTRAAPPRKTRRSPERS